MHLGAGCLCLLPAVQPSSHLLLPRERHLHCDVNAAGQQYRPWLSLQRGCGLQIVQDRGIGCVGDCWEMGEWAVGCMTVLDTCMQCEQWQVVNGAGFVSGHVSSVTLR
jgi:hypothetical protein